MYICARWGEEEERVSDRQPHLINCVLGGGGGRGGERESESDR